MMDQLFDTLVVGTVLQIGHPSNRVAWIKTGHGWINNQGKSLTREEMFDTLEHGAFKLLVGGKAQ